MTPTTARVSGRPGAYTVRCHCGWTYTTGSKREAHAHRAHHTATCTRREDQK